MRKCKTISSTDTRVIEEGGRGGAPCARALVSLQALVKTMGMQVVPLKPMEVHSGANIHAAAQGGPHSGAVGYALEEGAAHGKLMLEMAPGRNFSLWRGAHAGAGFLAGLVFLWENHAGEDCS